MKKSWRVVQHIYEGNESEPTLTHVFYGETLERAWGIHDAHMKTDSFMRSCVTSRRFRDFRCHAATYVEHADARGEWRRVPDGVPARSR